ncbi:fungal specific transcription factor domain-containing protein [Aspergillus lucknowensis]|uniref:Fungal-specific transcription factor domain-containing protein n=1 Tax=Aspergillus lucknowensis TaxID=176173 RepID=A0ABR4LNB9_9EURO
MEAHLQELGLELKNTEPIQASLRSVEPEQAQLPPPTSFGPGNVTDQGNWRYDLYPEDNYTDSTISRPATYPAVDPVPAMSDFHNKGEGRFPSDLAGLLIPRCLLDAPVASSLRALSPEGMEWVSRKSGVTPELSPENCLKRAMYGPLNDNFPRKVFYPLPSKEETSSLLYEYLQNFNSLCPLFEQAKLVSLFKQNQADLDVALRAPALWASVNVVLALGIAFRTKERTSAQAEHQRSWLFIKNAFSAFHDLCLGQPDLWSVQALLGMAVFFLGTMSAEPCNFLVAAAVHMSHQIGLGTRDDRVALSAQEREHRRNIFWIAYCLDREVSLRFGKPPAQSDDDMNIGLPAVPVSGSGQVIPTMNRHNDFNIFRAQCQLATIKGQLYKDLYSAAARDRPLGEIMASVGALDDKLQDWRKSLPSEYQPEEPGLPTFPKSSISVMLLFLQYSYYNCIIAMHQLIVSRRISVAAELLKRKDINISAPSPRASKLFTSASLCAHAARASIRLMKYIPEGQVSLIGMLIHYPIVALSTLSSSIIQNPRNASRLSDMKLIGQVETFLSSLIISIPNEAIALLKAYCANYRAAAEAAVQKTMQFCGT